MNAAHHWEKLQDHGLAHWYLSTWKGQGIKLLTLQLVVSLFYSLYISFICNADKNTYGPINHSVWPHTSTFGWCHLGLYCYSSTAILDQVMSFSLHTKQTTTTTAFSKSVQGWQNTFCIWLTLKKLVHGFTSRVDTHSNFILSGCPKNSLQQEFWQGTQKIDISSPVLASVASILIQNGI